MRIDEQLKILAVKTNMTFAEISGKVDKSPQAFSQKMKRGNYTLDELEEIARATGTKITCYFELPNGEMIKLV
ncbi:MAG: XRE family transcriptional regulator [Lachnospiraceae bacterium]|nr:XRE family transcriptional regulator [Lachnospiraceae bacterium]